MLKSLNIKPVYTTDAANVAKEFYNPTLSKAVSYKRVAGYFNSASLAQFANGVEGLIKNDGYYQLLISHHITEEDFNLIKSGYDLREKYTGMIEEQLLGYDNLSNNQKKDFSNLAYLIQIGVVDIKIGFTSNCGGLFHSKFGIITDKQNDKVYFSGSFNETEAAFERNYENLTIVRSWTNTLDSETILEQEKHFDIMWENKLENFVIVKEFNEVLRLNIIQFSKGEVIKDSSLLEKDALILYYHNHKLHVENTLINKEVDQANRSIKRIQRMFLMEYKLWNFKVGLTYREIETVIKNLLKYGERKNVKVVIAKSVYDFIESQEFDIAAIHDRGLLIKNKSDLLKDDFKAFNDIVSNEITRDLRQIQSWVSFYMANMRRVGNFSVPGSGKTAMVYGAYAYLSSESINEVNQIVMIGPKSSFISWKDEFEEVFQDKRQLKVLDIHAPNFHDTMLTRNIRNYNVILINYESLPKYKNQLKDIINLKTMLVFDEVHKIKKINGVRSSVALELSQLAKYRYILTGTPIPNSYEDAYVFLNIMYQNEYADFFNFTIHELGNMNPVLAEEFNGKLFPFYWRVTKRDLGVPPVNPDNLNISIASDQEQAVIDLLWRKYGDIPFVLYTRLIQFSSNPALLKGNIERAMFVDVDFDNELNFEFNDEMIDIPNYTRDELSLINNLDISTKFIHALEKTNELISQGRTVLIWCIFIDTMKKVVQELRDAGHKVALIYGEITASEREKIIADFQSGFYDVLVTNPHTLAESISLHRVCHDAIYLEYSFNLTHMLQSRDRIHRLGLKDTDETNYYYFLLEGQNERRNTIDRKIYDKLKDKEEIMIHAIEGTHITPDFDGSEEDEIKRLIKEEQEKFEQNL